MLAASFILFVFLILLSESKFILEISEQKENLRDCVKDVVETYISVYKELTYVDMNSNDKDIINSINSITLVAIISRTAEIRLNVQDQSYLITAGNTSDFIRSFEDLVKETWWNPLTRFLIFINNHTKSENDLREVFDVLLNFHILDVVLVNGLRDLDLFSYNPYENYGCGLRYKSVIHYGKCSNIRSHFELYPNKFITGLKNCTFRVASPHWPPYTFDPNKTNNKKRHGVEEFVLNEISILEEFALNYSYSDSGEEYSEITSDMSAVGPLILLQTGEADIIFGGILLTQRRAMAFDGICNHLPLTEDIRYLVKKATPVSSWKNVYLEFDNVVWLALFIAFISYFCTYNALVRPSDRGKVLLNMMAYLVLNGSKIKGNFLTKYLFIFWIWFAYLINTYYQSSLVSLTTNPSLNYQISNEKDIERFNLKPCVSNVMRNYLLSVDYSIEKNERLGCDKLFESIHSVSQSDDLFTITLRTIYMYNAFRFYDKTGEPLIYTVSQPISKAIYGIFFYKGFPLLDKLSTHALRLKESGLIEHHKGNLFFKNMLEYKFITNEVTVHFDIAWYILISGYFLSFSIYVAETLIYRFMASTCKLSVTKM